MRYVYLHKVWLSIKSKWDYKKKRKKKLLELKRISWKPGEKEIYGTSSSDVWVIPICLIPTLSNSPALGTTENSHIAVSSRITRSRQWHPTPVLLPGKFHGRSSLVGCSPWGRKESDMTERLHFHFSLSCIGEGNGNPLQSSYLENPMGGGAWWDAVPGVAKSRTRLSDFTFAFHFHALEKEMATHSRCSCLENPRDRGACWAAAHGVAQSRTRLKRLSSSSSRITKPAMLGRKTRK